MKAASLSEIKKELLRNDPVQLSELILRLARYKKENKELLTYLLFESDNEAAFIESIKVETDAFFEDINSSNLYFAKKVFGK